MRKTIKGKIEYQTIEGGFWGIVASDGSKWQIINMPEQLKYSGRQVKVTIEVIDANEYDDVG